MRPAVLAGSMAIPLEHISDIQRVTKALTVKHQPLGAEEPTIVEAFRFNDADERIEVPRQFGLDYCHRNNIPFEDQTCVGFAADFPRIPTPRDYQAPLLDEISDCFDSYFDIIFKAHTGWGKTIGALIVAARSGATTLVIVDQENLKEQWLEALATHFGMTVASGHVGIVQGKTCDYRGRSVVVAMVQTLSQKVYEPEFYSYFGRVFFDEVHTVGAPTFSVVLLDFPAEARLGVSATPKRKDDLQKLLDYSLGKIRVAAEKEHEESAVYVRDSRTVYSFYGNVSKMVGRIINEVADDARRNLDIAQCTLDLYETGRDGLILSDRIEHLKHLISLLYYLGADPEQLGLYAGFSVQYRYAKDPKPKRKPNYLGIGEDFEDAEYTPITLQLISKRSPAKVLARIKETAGMLFGTYQKCGKGFDEPRLLFGIDATPRSEVEQIHGRILRDRTGKMPIWVTWRDTMSYRLMFSFAKRISGYLKSNGRFYEWRQDGELIECHESELMKEAYAISRDLSAQEIREGQNGVNRLVPAQQRKREAVDAIKAKIEQIAARGRR